MARVLLISPPYIDLYGRLDNAAGRYFPLGIGYIASFLRSYGGHTLGLFEPEAQRLTLNDIIAHIKRFEPDIIGITSSTPNFSRAVQLAESFRKECRAKIVIGGVHASALPEFIMEHYSHIFDCVIVGEGEETMNEVVKAYEAGYSLNSVSGVAFKYNGAVVMNPPRNFIKDLDIIPYPSRDLIPQNLFIPNAHNVRHRECISILTSRGCPFNCTFCASRIVSGKLYRMHSAEYVLDEMEMLKKSYNAKQLLITDDTFTINRGRLVAICEGMIKKRLNMQWFCFSQVNTVDKDLLKLMKEAGCYNIGFGVESSNINILKRMNKNMLPEKAEETVRTANDLGIKTQAFYIFGTEGETKEQMEDTIAFSIKVGATLAFFNMLVPFPGTVDFSRLFTKDDLKDIRWEDFVAVGERCVLKNLEVSPKEIEGLIARANMRYYMHPKRLFNILKHIKTPYEFINYSKGGLAFFRQVLQWSKGCKRC